MSSNYIRKIRTEDGDKQIDYEALANLPTIPSKTSNLENDSNFLTSIPDEYITEDELNAKGYLTEHQDLSDYAKKSELPAALVSSVNGKIGEVILTSSDVSADPGGTAESKVTSHNISEESHSDIRLLINNLTTRLNTIANSEDVDLDQLGELVAYIKSNRTLIENVTTNKINVSDIVDNLETNVWNKPLSAKQGVLLKGLIDTIVVPTLLSQLSGDSAHRLVTDSQISAWNNKANIATTLAGYGITDGATKEEVNALKNYVTPQMYGAKADGVTNDTVAIQSALNASSYVYIPDGTYMIDAVSGGIKPKNNQRIVLSNNAVLKAITNGEKGYKIVYFEDVDNVHISGGKILGDNATHDPTNGGDSGFGIHISHSRDITIENMEIADCWGDCIITGYKAVKDEVSGEYYGIQSENIKIYNCKLHGGRRQGISVVSGLGVTIKDCEIYNITEKAPKSGIDIEPDWVGLAEDVLIEGSTIYDTSGASIIVTGEGKTKLVKIANCNLDSINCVYGDKTIIDNCNIRSLTARNRSNIFVSNCQLNKITTCGGSALVNNCMFENGEETAVILSTLDGFTGDQSLITERLSFNHCIFKINSTATKFLHLTVTTSYDFHQENNIEFYGCKIDLSESNATFCQRLPGKELRIENCDIILKSGEDVAFESTNQRAPARLIVRNSKISCDANLANLMWLRGRGDKSLNYDVELTNNKISSFTSLVKCENNITGNLRVIHNDMPNESINGTNTLDVFSTSAYAKSSDIPTIPTVPTKTSQLTNDSGFITKNDIPEAQAPDLAGYATQDFVKEYAQPKGNYLTQHQDISGKADKSSAETWTFTLTDGSTVTKKVVIA